MVVSLAPGAQELYDGEETPLAGHALQLVRSAIRELDAGAHDEVSDRARHEHLARLRLRGHARADVHGHAADVVVDQLALSGVDARADVDALRRDRSPMYTRTGSLAGPSNVARKPSPAVLTSRPRKRESCDRTTVVSWASRSARQARSPIFAARCVEADDIGEQDGGEHPILGHGAA